MLTSFYYYGILKYIFLQESYCILPKIFLGGKIMSCLKIYNRECERSVIRMANKRKNKTDKNGEAQYSLPETTVKFLKWVAGGCGALVLLGLGVVGWIAVQVYNLGSISSSNNEAISGIEKRLDNVEKDLKEINSGLYGASESKGIYTRLELIEQRMNSVEGTLNLAAIKLSDTLFAYIGDSLLIKNESNTTPAPLEEDMCIGTDAEGNEYIAKNMVDEKLLLTYEENGKEIYFLGQYNENYHWDGYCITNVYYPDGSLYGICESNFLDGERLDYKTVLSVGENKWDYYNRTCVDGISRGETVSYTFVYDKVMNFTKSNVRITDIIYADDFLSNQDVQTKQYYFGKTSDGKYNDDSGEAYQIIFNEDETVKTLYVGRFANGTYNDNTGEAWDIAYSDVYGFYVYNAGVFKNGSAVNQSAEKISKDKINEIIEGFKFECELTWK